MLQPIIGSSISDGKYKIIAGERRWRACKIAKFTDIPVIIKDLGDTEIIEIALIENIQREQRKRRQPLVVRYAIDATWRHLHAQLILPRTQMH